MADQKISELNELTSPAPDDVLPIVDISASETKKITKANLFSGLSASDISISTLGTPTYNNVQDWFITTQSAGKISGGEITDNGDGTVSVSAGTGFIKTTDSDTGDLLSFDWSANNSVSLTDNDTNYIYVAYNGGSPIIQTATSIPSDRNTNVMLGLVYKEGTDLYIVTAGQEMANYNKKTLWKDIDVNGKFQYVSGLKISESGTRNIAISSGYIYTGLTKQSYSAFDSSGSDTFATFYRDGAGGWTKTTGQTQVDNQYYDDGSGTLASLSPNSYTCRYVYMDIKGNVYVLYGQAQYARLADAIEEDVPSSIPKILKDISLLLGKIIIKQGQTNFELVTSAFTSPVAYETVRDHDDLGGLQGGTAGEYYHLTNSQYTEATQYASSTQNGLLSSTDWNTFNSKLSSLSDDTSPQLGGELDAGAHSIGFTLKDWGNSGTALTIDWRLGNKHKVTLTDNCTFTFTDPSKPGNFVLMLVQDATGGRTVTWPANCKWAGGTAPTLSTAANAIDIVSFFYDGTNYYGVASLNFS